MDIEYQDSRNSVLDPAERTQPLGGTYSPSTVGMVASKVRQFYDDMAPRGSDSTEVRVAKEVFRWSSVVAGAAFVAVVVL
jgi:hypothetical protein